MATLLGFLSVSICLFTVLPLSHADTVLLTPDEQKEAHKDIAIVDHGVHGELFLIDEEDMIEVLKRRLLQLKERRSNGSVLTAVKADVVPEKTFFVAGSHHGSFDSRYQEFGLIPLAQVRGQVWPIF